VVGAKRNDILDIASRDRGFDIFDRPSLRVNKQQTSARIADKMLDLGGLRLKRDRHNDAAGLPDRQHQHDGVGIISRSVSNAVPELYTEIKQPPSKTRTFPR
jgi:hypothetical protein